MKHQIQSLIAFLIAASLSILLTSAQNTPARSRSALAPKLRPASDPSERIKANDNKPTINKLERPAISNASNRSSPLVHFIEDELPADFYEMPAEQLDLGMNATGIAPVPMLNVKVLQNGQLIDSEITVHPGTPLEMVIYLDEKSAKVYGLLASNLKVEDGTFRKREEVIIANGCSKDTYIFGNFEHNPEDKSLRAKFRAFKFPDSNYVHFMGTVNVCIKQCAEVKCGGGRKKRASYQKDGPKDERLVMTVSMVLRITNHAESP